MTKHEPLDPHKGTAPRETDETDDLNEVINDVASATMKSLMSDRGRKRVEYVKYRAKDRAAKAARSSSG